jgi:hypothetical protein
MRASCRVREFVPVEPVQIQISSMVREGILPSRTLTKYREIISRYPYCNEREKTFITSLEDIARKHY